jgi:hypothetical protein
MGIFGRHRIKRPVQGHAEIVEAWKPPQSGAGGGNCKMKLKLDVPGVPPQVVKYHELSMTENRWPEVGMRVAVTVDADHPDRVDVDWDSVFGEKYGGNVLGPGVEMLGAVAGIDLDLSKGPDSGQPEHEVPDDYEEQIAALNAEFAAGRITYDQMAQRIQAIMMGPG